jgi:hypothetical protein
MPRCSNCVKRRGVTNCGHFASVVCTRSFSCVFREKSLWRKKFKNRGGAPCADGVFMGEYETCAFSGWSPRLGLRPLRSAACWPEWPSSLEGSSCQASQQLSDGGVETGPVPFRDVPTGILAWVPVGHTERVCVGRLKKDLCCRCGAVRTVSGCQLCDCHDGECFKCRVFGWGASSDC